MKPVKPISHALRQSAPLTKLALAILLLCALAFSGVSNAATEPAQSSAFQDVAEDHLYRTGIEYLKSNGIVSGYPDGTFKPQSAINRAEFTKIIIGAVVQDPKGENCFPDVKTEWFAKYVCEAKTRGIIDGYPDGNFKPAETIKFSEASKIVANAFNLPLSGITGVNNNNTWYHPFVEALGTQKAIPVSVDFFDENITRDEMAEIVYRLKAKKTNSASRTYSEINGETIISGASCDALVERYRALNQRDQVFLLDGDEGEQSRQDMQNAVPVSAPASEQGEQKGLGGGSGDAGANEYSQTNIQVEGVDEADIVKSDGKYLYLLRSNTVRIIEAYPAQNMKELVSLQLGEEDEQFYPSEMYVTGDQLIVLGNTNQKPVPVIEDSANPEDTSPDDETTTSSDDTSESEGMMTDSAKLIAPYPGSNRTKVFIVNIQDRIKPSVTRWVEYDGYLQSSRRVGNNLYVVLNWYPNYYYPYYPLSLEKSSPDTSSFIPHMRDSGTKGAASPSEVNNTLIAPCPDIKILPKPQSWNNLIVSAVPLNDTSKKVSSEVIIGESGNVYSSAENIYIASVDWSGGLYRSRGDYGTAIYRFALNNGEVEFGAKGRVPGTVLNQFSMDEWNGTFRIATTQTDWSFRSNQSTNGLYTLNVDTMKEEGKLEDIAPGESIYSARFMGSRGYLVTFRQTDPLFVIDLQDPRSPKIEGKLKIPGYSNYLHPYDENHLIGIGNEVDLAQSTEESIEEEGFIPWDAIVGLKISLFDITDVNKPKELFKEVIGDRGTTSDAQYNHKAFLFDKEKNLLAFPVQVQELQGGSSCTENTYSVCPTSCQKVCVPSSCTYENGIRICTTDCDGENSCRAPRVEYGKPSFNGSYAYGIDLQKGFTLRGKVTHYTQEEQDKAREQGYYEDWQKSIQRVLYMGDSFYSVSGKMVQANALSDFTIQKSLTLSGDQYDYFYEY